MTSCVTLAAEEKGSSSHNICLGNYKLYSRYRILCSEENSQALLSYQLSAHRWETVPMSNTTVALEDLTSDLSSWCQSENTPHTQITNLLKSQVNLFSIE